MLVLAGDLASSLRTSLTQLPQAAHISPSGNLCYLHVSKEQLAFREADLSSLPSAYRATVLGLRGFQEVDPNSINIQDEALIKPPDAAHPMEWTVP